jgi:hypothetical protein
LVRIIWTPLQQERQHLWEQQLGITRSDVETVGRNPAQVPGDRGTSVAQSRWRGGLMRVVFVEAEDARKILTVYWTSRVERYWEEKGNAG